MSTSDKYFGIGGSYRLDASGNRVPAESWPDAVLAVSAPINTSAAPPEPAPEPPAPAEPEPTPAKPAKTTATTATPDKE